MEIVLVLHCVLFFALGALGVLAWQLKRENAELRVRVAVAEQSVRGLVMQVATFQAQVIPLDELASRVARHMAQ